MLDFVFGFHARLGRMNYFLSTLALAAVMTLVSFGIANYAFQQTPRGAQLSFDPITWPLLAETVVFLWVTFTLQAMRIRDIGWDPVCIIPAWAAALVIDRMVAAKIPAWSVDHAHHGTVAGALINLALIAALTFWPSAPETASAPIFPARRSPNNPFAGPRTTSASESRIAAVIRTKSGSGF